MTATGKSQRFAPAEGARAGEAASLPDFRFVAHLLQCEFHVRHMLAAARGVLPQAASDQPFELGKIAAGNFTDLLRLFHHNGREGGDARFALEGALPGDHLVEHRAEGKDIAARVHRLAFGLFRRHVGQATHHDAFFRTGLLEGHGTRGFGGSVSHPARLRELRQSEVEHLHAALRVHHDVGGLQIAMHDSSGMRGRQPIGHLHRHAQGFGEPHALARNQLVERLPIDQLHHDEGLSILFANLVDGDDIGVIQRRGGLGLLDKAREPLLIAESRFRQELDGHQTVETAVPGFIHPSHSALADLLQKREVAEPITQHMGSMVLPWDAAGWLRTRGIFGRS